MDLKSLLNHEIQRTRPDFIVYRPQSVDGSTRDTGNEHFLVFDGPDRSLLAVWTQSSFEGAGDHRIVFSRSDDEGHTWAPPKHLVGPAQKRSMPPVELGISPGFPRRPNLCHL